MKQLIILLFLTNTFPTFGQVDTVFIDEHFEAKREYAMCRIPLEEEDNSKFADIEGYYLVMLPPVYGTRQDTAYINVDSFYNMTLEGEKEFNISYRYEYIEGYIQPNFHTRVADKNCLSADPRDCITFEMEYVPPVWNIEFGQIIQKSDYENGQIDSILMLVYDYHFITEPVRLIKTTILNPAAYHDLNSLQILYIKGEKWSEIRQVICPFHPVSNRVIHIQLALRTKGYLVPLNSILDGVTRKAIVDFQKNNNLPTGRLDIETLKALGIERFAQEEADFRGGYQYPNSPRIRH